MATVPIDESYITEREYLHTSYSPDCEYVNGRIVERNLGEKGHSVLQMYLAFIFMLNRQAWGIDVYPELRTKVAIRHYRVPDVLIVRAGHPFESVLEDPPLIAIEILSPDDKLSDLQEKIDAFVDFGIQHIWVFNPRKRAAFTGDRDGLHRVHADALTVPGTPIRVELKEVFAELDRP